MRRRSVCLILTPLTSIYRGWATSWEQLGHLGIHCRTNQRAPRGSRWRAVARSVRSIQGVVRPGPTTSRVVLSSSDWYVVPYDGFRCPRGLEAVCSGWGPLNPFIEHMATFDSSGSACLGFMRCHGHMASCVPARRHMAWCGSHRAHMTSCAYLSHPGFDVCKWDIHLDHLDEPVIMVQTNLAFKVVYDDAIPMPLVYLLSAVSFHAHFDVSCNKR
jgi:hypothetical protein